MHSLHKNSRCSTSEMAWPRNDHNCTVYEIQDVFPHSKATTWEWILVRGLHRVRPDSRVPHSPLHPPTARFCKWNHDTDGCIFIIIPVKYLFWYEVEYLKYELLNAPHRLCLSTTQLSSQSPLSPSSFLLSLTQVSLPHQCRECWVTQSAYAASWGEWSNPVVTQSQHYLPLDIRTSASRPTPATL